MASTLDHAHAEALLAAHVPDAVIAHDVDEACAAGGLRGLRFVRADVDLDLPVPLVLEVDACSLLRLCAPDGREVGALYIDVRGEAYDRRYHVAVRLVGDERQTIFDGALEPEALAGAWHAGLVALSRLVGQLVPGRPLAAVLVAAVRPPLREVVAAALATV